MIALNPKKYKWNKEHSNEAKYFENLLNERNKILFDFKKYIRHTSGTPAGPDTDRTKLGEARVYGMMKDLDGRMKFLAEAYDANGTKLKSRKIDFDCVDNRDLRKIHTECEKREIGTGHEYDKIRLLYLIEVAYDSQAMEMEIPDGIPYEEMVHIDSIAKGMGVNDHDRLFTREEKFQDKDTIRNIKTFLTGGCSDMCQVIFFNIPKGMEVDYLDTESMSWKKGRMDYLTGVWDSNAKEPGCVCFIAPQDRREKEGIGAAITPTQLSFESLEKIGDALGIDRNIYMGEKTTKEEKISGGMKR